MRSPRGAGLVAAAVAAVALTRVGLVLVLDRVVDGAEFTDDVAMHLDMASRPLDLIGGETGVHGQHPPLLPVVEWLLLRPLDGLGGLWPARAAYVVVECLVAGLVVALGRGDAQRRLLAVVVVCSPVLWMGTAVMAQDEVIAAAFLAGGLLLWQGGRDVPAVALVGVGVAAAKVFLVLPLVALVLLGSRAGRPRRALVALVAAGLPYAVAAASAAAQGAPLPLSGFSPDAGFGTNLWVFALDGGVVSADAAKVVSLVLASSLAALPLVLAHRRRGPDGSVPEEVLGAVCAAMLLWFLSAFYHSTAEYLVLVVPPLALVTMGAVRTALVHSALAAAWVVNVFYGVEQARSSGSAGGKARLADLYGDLTGLDPSLGHTVAVVVVSTACLAVAAWLTAQLADRPADGRAAGAGSAVPAGDVDDHVDAALR